MLYYLSALIWIYVISLNAHKLPTLIAIPASLPIVAFSAFRGESGKDTTAYIDRFFAADELGQDFTIDAEPIITSLMYFSRLVVGVDVRGFFALHAFLLFFVYFLIAKKRALNSAYLLSVGPVFFIDGITNGMRVTLAYHALLLAYTYRNRVSIKYILWVFALFSHVTSIFSIALSLALKSPGKTLVGLMIFIFAIYGLVVGGLLDLISLAPRVFSKLDKYTDLALPNWYSGVVDLLIIWSLLFVLIFNSSISIGEKALALMCSVLFCALLYLGIQQSLAVIRVSKLSIIAIFTSHLVAEIKIQKCRWVMPALGLVYTANYLRQVATDPGFLPYG